MSFANFSLSGLPYYDVYTYFMDIYSPAALLTLAFGVITNIINIIVFLKTGSKDNVTLSLLALSISDLAYLVIVSPHVIFRSINYMVPAWFGSPVNWFIHITILWIPFYWYAFVFYDTSTLITVYISVVRCACVALPFKVKGMFTPRRTVMTFTVFFVFVFLLRLPMLINKRFIREFDELTNTYIVVVTEVDDGGFADTINDIVSRNVMPWSCVIVVVTCVVVMTVKLRESAKFRLTNKMPDKHSKLESAAAKEATHNDDASLENTTARTTGQSLSTKEVKVLRAVILVAVIFIICQMPFMAYSLARRLESQFDNTQSSEEISKFINLFSVASTMGTLCAVVNASVNIFVYFNHNSRYRQCLVELFAKRPLGSKLV